MSLVKQMSDLGNFLSEMNLLVYTIEEDFSSVFGGDEFVIACRISGSNDICRLQNRLEKTIDSFNIQNDRKSKISMSTGCCTMSESGIQSITELLQYADNLLYEQMHRKKKR